LASTQSKLLKALLKLINKKALLRRQLASGNFDSYASAEPPSKFASPLVMNKFQIRDRNVFRLSSKDKNNSNKHILYLHGGAYVQQFNRFHWEFLAELIAKTNCIVTAPDYPLAPTSTFKESFEMVGELYSQLLSSEQLSDFVFMGDSAGGGFALALAQKVRNDGIRMPSQVIMLCPWLDITLANPEIEDIDRDDPFLGRESLQQAGKLYAGDADPKSYLLSPINGPLDGLGKISVFAGSHEILVADARKLKLIAIKNGIDLNYREYAGMVHDWMFLNLPESRRAKQEIFNLILQA
jgi:acetyl esterase/lipase